MTRSRSRVSWSSAPVGASPIRRCSALKAARVNAVNAGVVDTDALGYFPNRDALLAEYAARTPAGPVLTPSDVANAIYLLCLPEAAMINGATLFVDGGFAISG